MYVPGTVAVTLTVPTTGVSGLSPFGVPEPPATVITVELVSVPIYPLFPVFVRVLPVSERAADARDVPVALAGAVAAASVRVASLLAANSAAPVALIVVVTVEPTGAVWVPEVSVAVTTTSAAAAEAGTTDNRPKPIAATVASAMRLKVVFVDICFLSISRSEEFPPVGFG